VRSGHCERKQALGGFNEGHGDSGPEPLGHCLPVGHAPIVPGHDPLHELVEHRHRECRVTVVGAPEHLEKAVWWLKDWKMHRTNFHQKVNSSAEFYQAMQRLKSTPQFLRDGKTAPD